jgi:hypothetical protein
MSRVRVSPSGSSAVVEIDEEQADTYLAAGWVRSDEEAQPENETKTRSGKPSKAPARTTK